MEYIKGIEQFQKDVPTAITIGKFDGMHRGHSILLSEISKQATRQRMPLVLTFDTSPRIALKQKPQEVRFLFTQRERNLIMEERGVKVLLEMAFTDEMIHMSPQDFIALLVNRLHMEFLCVGSDFRFGYQGSGDVRLLYQLADTYGFVLCVKEKIKTKQKLTISSTDIRNDIVVGRLEEANEKLGFPFFLLGDIRHGNHIGRTLGMPTINIRPDKDKLLVPCGVYITETQIGDNHFPGVTNVGFRPTIQEEKKELLVETHLLDFHQDVYGDIAKVSFRKFLRQEQTFASLESLKEQIKLDASAAREYILNKK